MAKTYGEQFKEALACNSKEQADKWFADEILRYEREFGKSAAEATNIIHANLGYMAGYYDDATAKKIAELFGANHPIFGGSDYHNTTSPEKAVALGQHHAIETNN
jgi:hypothetical protein